MNTVENKENVEIRPANGLLLGNQGSKQPFRAVPYYKEVDWTLYQSKEVIAYVDGLVKVDQSLQEETIEENIDIR